MADRFARLFVFGKISLYVLGLPGATVAAWKGWNELQGLQMRQHQAERQQEQAEQVNDLNARIMRCQVEILKRKVFGRENVDIDQCYQIAVEEWRAANHAVKKSN